MYLTGESNVAGAIGNLSRKQPVFQPNMNTTGAPVGHTTQLTGFMNLPGAVGNMGAIAEAPTVRRDMQGTELVPDPRNPGKFIHPNILQNPGYEQRYRDASQNWMKQEGEKRYNEQIQKLRNQNQEGGFGKIPY